MPAIKTALVTGAARRIGRAIAEDLSRHGWAVAVHYHRSADEAEATAARCRANGVRAAAIQADLARLEGFEALIGEAEVALGPITLLVNNASIFEKDEFGALAPQSFADQFNLNLAAPIFLAQAFVRKLPADMEGNVIHLIDERVWKPTPEFFSYQLTKSALLTATRTMAQALAPRVRVNAIGPGPTLPSPRQDPSDFARQAAAVPLGRAVALDDFGRAVRFLAETRSITGQMIALDGGQHLAWQTPDVLEAHE